MLKFFQNPMFKTRRFWIIAGGVVAAAVCLGLAAAVINGRRQISQAELQTGEVTSITAISSVQTSGQISAKQQATLNWGTTGTVAEVFVKVGDPVKAGDVLMALDPTTAPQTVILAQTDLVNARKALDEVLHPTALAIAIAEKAVAEAQDALDKAQSALYSAQHPAAQSLYDALADAQLKLTTAQANRQLSNVDPNVSAYNNAVFLTNFYRRNWEQAQDTYNQSNGNTDAKDALDRAWNKYQEVLNNELALKLRIDTDQAGKQDAVKKAQDSYDKAKENLDNALAGPDAVKVALAKAKAEAAAATLKDAQDTLAHRIGEPDPDEVAAATARLQAAQATVNAMKIIAPIDGEVMALNSVPGDTAGPTVLAAVVANRAQLHVDANVDESDVTKLQVGNDVTVTLDSLPDLSLKGKVTQINPVGQTSQGLVRYSVRTDLIESDPRVLLGMNASLEIVTQVQAGALAVPLDAVQLDANGEFVNRFVGTGAAAPAASAPGAVTTTPAGFERVAVVSGETQGDLVVVTTADANLQPGDKVQLIQPKPTSSNSPFGGG
jgi:HlyD family secretion protein